MSNTQRQSACDRQSGSSSALQTVFNTANVILGVSLLCLPSAFSKCGWLCAILLLMLCGYVSAYCGKILGACQYKWLKMKWLGGDYQSQIASDSPVKQQQRRLSSQLESKESMLSMKKDALVTYGDIGEAAFGLKGRMFIQIMFICELFAGSVAMLLLASHSVVLTLDLSQYELYVKLVAWSLMTVCTWPKSLSNLSYVSLLGIVCIINLTAVVLFDGFYKPDAIGSLRSVSNTYLLPEKWTSVPAAFGLFMAGFSAAPCFPGFYASMKQPQKFARSVNVAFGSAFVLYMIVGSCGYLMFGDRAQSVITENLRDPAYPRVIYFITMALVIINPFTKFPLLIFPIVLEIENFLFSKVNAGDDESILIPPSVQNSKSHVVDTDPSQCDKDDDDDDDEQSQLLPKSQNDREGENMYKGYSSLWLYLRTTLVKTSICVLVLVVAIIFPHFDRVLALLGSLFCTINSILFPVLCWLVFSSRQGFDDGEIDSAAPLAAGSVLKSYQQQLCIFEDKDSDRMLKSTLLKRIVAVCVLSLFFALAVMGTVFCIYEQIYH
ncbi:hypothetical protein MP228_011670 [Amoeboaphelidium protococcarum]|nr:hypothetical protein MP228_011670 [Amoeboaphelidium protococcarum]